MSDFAAFGDPARFEIAVRWRGDSEPRERRPAGHGWSLGDLRITVAGQALTRNRWRSGFRPHVTWYLAPLFRWLAGNWAALLHEEDFAWAEQTAAPAVVACHRALDKWISARDDGGRSRYTLIQEWYYRHALRSAAAGGLFPDLFLRRFLDDIEVSWSSKAPLFAPDGFTFSVEPGLARLPVEEVAGPLWEALCWVASVPPKLDNDDAVDWRGLSELIRTIPNLGVGVLERAYVDRHVLEMVRELLDKAGRPDLAQDDVSSARPFVRELSPAVLMFGGVSPNLGHGDVDRLCRLLVDRSSGRDGAKLTALVSSRGNLPLGIPHEDGYAFAEDLMDAIGMPQELGWVDVRTIVEELGIDVLEETLATDSIRGVALAGRDFKPLIFVNTNSLFNRSENGKRFTIAHELCHIIYDRTRAKRVTHVSGPWVAPGIERRANAFGAYLLMPRPLVLRHWRRQTGANALDVKAVAGRLHVNEIALVEHLYNLELIDEVERERLRAAFRTH